MDFDAQPLPESDDEVNSAKAFDRQLDANINCYALSIAAKASVLKRALNQKKKQQSKVRQVGVAMVWPIIN